MLHKLTNGDLKDRFGETLYIGDYIIVPNSWSLEFQLYKIYGCDNKCLKGKMCLDFNTETYPKNSMAHIVDLSYLKRVIKVTKSNEWLWQSNK